MQVEKVKNENIIKIKIDFTNVIYDKKFAQKMIRKLRNIRKQADLFRKNIKIELINKDFDDIHKITNQYQYYICVSINAVQIENKNDRYNYLYDEICFYLDHVCITQNLCDFKNDKCFAKRNTDTTMGCCHHFPNKKFGMLYQRKLVPCEFLDENGCTTKSIGCKMFMCDEVNKKGYKFTVYNVLLVRYFFNFIQKFIIITSMFCSKEEIMKKIIMCSF